MSRTIRIIGVPIDLGQSKRGVDMGPAALRYAGLAEKLRALGHRVLDGGNLPVAGRETVAAEAGQHFLPATAKACTAVYAAARAAVSSGETVRSAGSPMLRHAGSSGSMPMATSTPRRPRRAATFMAWVWPPSSAKGTRSWSASAVPVPSCSRATWC